MARKCLIEKETFEKDLKRDSKNGGVGVDGRIPGREKRKQRF